MEKSLKQLIREEVAAVFQLLNEEDLNEEYLDEKGFPRLIRSIAGVEPGIQTIGIITAENPRGMQIGKAENKLLNKDLAQDLRKMGYGFYQIKGKYGNVEKPFVIQNITREDLSRLGSKYDQDSVIFVEAVEDGSVAELIGTADNEYDVRSRVVLPFGKDESLEDFYSEYKGRKFVIPFFSDVFKDKALVRGRVV